ncbi:unnamed protein product [Miscanthus lutarioriparius]|uniref:Uncharacterized protein n=1 Tax=Miscanthus lutarioriparius TaxID=422564 RepID=A0A811MSV6_9POAL|nr:unnamed protein product [Miscanthus lutarioriparius]
MMKWCDDGGVAGAAKTLLLPLKPQLMRWQKQLAVSPAKTQVREPEVINVWELMDGLDDKDEEGDADGEERLEKLALGSPEFDPDVITAFRKELDEIPPRPDDPGIKECMKKPDGLGSGGGGDEVGVKKREIQRFPGIVRAGLHCGQQDPAGVRGRQAPGQRRGGPPDARGRQAVEGARGLRDGAPAELRRQGHCPGGVL